MAREVHIFFLIKGASAQGLFIMARIIYVYTFLILFLFSCTTHRFDHIRSYEKDKDDVSLIEVLNESKDAYIRAQAAHSLGRISSIKAVPHLIKGLEDGDWVVRYYSAWSLGKIGNSSAKSPLKSRLRREEDLYVIQILKSSLKSIK